MLKQESKKEGLSFHCQEQFGGAWQERQRDSRSGLAEGMTMGTREIRASQLQRTQND